MPRSMVTLDKEGIIAQPKIIPMVENLYPDVMKNVLKMRAEKKSYDTISRYVSDEVGIYVSREVLRRWCQEKELAT